MLMKRLLSCRWCVNELSSGPKSQWTTAPPSPADPSPMSPLVLEQRRRRERILHQDEQAVALCPCQQDSVS